MMTICKKILFVAILFLPALSFGQQYEFVKGTNRFEVVETQKTYEVICRRENGAISSRNKNILDRQLRLDAVDLIGAYILFKTQTELPANLFQIYVEGINLHYNAYVEGIEQKEKNVKGERCICYECEKKNYKIESATYNRVIDIPSLLEKHYAQDKGEASANLLYEYERFSSEQYVQLERDFLIGAAQLPQGIRLLQSSDDRFELTVFGIDGEELKNIIKQTKQSIAATNPYKQFCYEELVTAASLKEKATYYRQWQQSLSPSQCVWEDVLSFCSKNAETAQQSDGITFSDVIAAYPGAISPYGIRQPIDENSYNLAAKAYASSDFKESIRIMKEAIDSEGISPKTLNLLGASYRFDGNAKEAMPYLLLCFKLDPNTPYLSGNIALCLDMMKYPRMKEALSFLSGYAKEDWSKTEINKLLQQ